MVDLPAPFLPARATEWPAYDFIETSSSASVVP